MASFADFTNEVHLIKDLILTDMIYADEDYEVEALDFSKHLLATKYWFARISWANKRRYILSLLKEIRSAWALSLLLKSMWNCRPKDAVVSASQPRPWSSYDQVPLDHNRTAQPVKTLLQVMTNDRKWFHSLEPESQAMVLSELLTVAGGPVMWEVLERAQQIYERYHKGLLQNLQECVVLDDQAHKNAPDKVQVKKEPQPTPAEGSRRKFSTPAEDSEGTQATTPGNAQKELEQNLAAWNSTLNKIRESQKLEEVEMTFIDGTKRKIWKIARQKPEAIETVDFVQLLPSWIGKRILSYLPQSELPQYAHVNSYWAYLVDELRAELTARSKIAIDIEKLQELMLKHDTSLNDLALPGFTGAASSVGVSVMPSTAVPLKYLPSIRASEKTEKSGVSFRLAMQKIKPRFTKQKPIRNLAELSERLERRGAADENLWLWCENVVRSTKKKHGFDQEWKAEEGVMRLGNMHFPCPMMQLNIKVPLRQPLYKDPSHSSVAVQKLKKRTLFNSNIGGNDQNETHKRFSLWSHDFSSLYKVLKIASYQSPV